MTGISELIETHRLQAVRVINSILTVAYWEIGRRIVEFEQDGAARSEYGDRLLDRLSKDLSAKHGRGFSRTNISQMRNFYLRWEIVQTVSEQFEARAKYPMISGESPDVFSKSTHAVLSLTMSIAFPLSWSHYVRLIAVDKPHARAFYESEAIRGGWSVRQLDRQISTQFFERTVRAKDQAAMLDSGQEYHSEDALALQEEIRDPYLLEFLNLKDEYSERELEEALIRHLETFLLELGNGFTFVARQKRIRIGDEWYRMDLLLFHRRLKCLVIIDLKIGKFTHADAGQMNLYLNYAREHLLEAGENEPVGLILCSAKNDAVVHYALGGINANVVAAHYMTSLLDEETLRQEIIATRRALAMRRSENATEE